MRDTRFGIPGTSDLKPSSVSPISLFPSISYPVSRIPSRQSRVSRGSRVSSIRNKDQCLSPHMRGYLVCGDCLPILGGDNRRGHICAGRSVWSIWSIWSIWLVWLVWFNQMNETDRTDQTDETDQFAT